MNMMIERVGKAIYAATSGHSESDVEELFIGKYPNVDEIFGGWARAAIEAMRDPLPEMISEGESLASIGIGKPSDDEALPRVWRGVIDAALKEKESTQ